MNVFFTRLSDDGNFDNFLEVLIDITKTNKKGYMKIVNVTNINDLLHFLLNRDKEMEIFLKEYDISSTYMIKDETILEKRTVRGGYTANFIFFLARNLPKYLSDEDFT